MKSLKWINNGENVQKFPNFSHLFILTVRFDTDKANGVMNQIGGVIAQKKKESKGADPCTVFKFWKITY